MSIKNLKVGINGFGRIGRAVARQILMRDHHQIVHINDINSDYSNLRYLLKYDTTYGQLDRNISVNEKGLIFGDFPVAVTHESKIDLVNWLASGVDVIIEATGVKHNEVGAKKLAQKGIPTVITQNSDQADYTLVFGVNEKSYNPKEHLCVSTSICDANACGPVLSALNSAFGINHGFITTLHPWLSYQNLMDGPSRSQAYPGATYSHYPLGRSSIGNLIPKPTTVVTACEKVLPEIKGKLKCMSYRVPTSVVSTADMTIELAKPVNENIIVEVLEQHQKNSGGAKVIRVSDEPLISVDFLKDEFSSIVDRRWLMLNDSRHLKIVLWYDNEWGYSRRVIDTINCVSENA